MLQHYSTQREIGVLIIMIIEMIGDLKVWALLTAVFTLAFMVTFVAVTDGPTAQTLGGTMWAMYGEFYIEYFSDFSGAMGETALWFYAMISNVLLVNLLIAMMSDTYQKIKDNADIEWKFSRVSSILEAIERTHPVPPPFSFPLILGRLLWWLTFGLFRASPSEATLETEENEAWRVGGRLYHLKRKREKIAKQMLSDYQRKLDKEDEESSDEL